MQSLLSNSTIYPLSPRGSAVVVVVGAAVVVVVVGAGVVVGVVVARVVVGVVVVGVVVVGLVVVGVVVGAGGGAVGGTGRGNKLGNRVQRGTEVQGGSGLGRNREGLPHCSDTKKHIKILSNVKVFPYTLTRVKNKIDFTKFQPGCH